MFGVDGGGGTGKNKKQNLWSLWNLAGQEGPRGSTKSNREVMKKCILKMAMRRKRRTVEGMWKVRKGGYRKEGEEGRHLS